MNNGKMVLALLLAAALTAGCDIPLTASSSGSSESRLLTGETVSGIITKVNGNEITLDLVTLRQQERAPAGEGDAPPDGGSGDAPEAASSPAGGSGDAPASGGGRGPGGQEGGASGGREKSAGQGSRQGGGSGGAAPGGGMPGGTAPGGMPESGTAGGGTQRSYTRTGESALYQIPVGAEVITLTGTSRDFNSLSPDLLVTITFREDNVTPGQVQVIESLS